MSVGSYRNIKDRKFSFCPTLSGLDLNDLIVHCPMCTKFFAACCPHQSLGGQMLEPEQRICHHFQLVFTDGACSNNGQGNAAKAGLGIVIGVDNRYSWSIIVDDTLDTAPRTNQRAELLAAIEGLKKLEQMNRLCSNVEDEANHNKSAARRRATVNEDYRAEYIVVTDLEYVVRGITEWFPEWRVRYHSGLIFKICNTNGIIL